MTAQSIRFLDHDLGRIAWATSGQGPPLLMGGWWMSHLDLDWNDPLFRAFIERLGAHRTVVRYDRPGTGVSAEGGSIPEGIEEESAVLEAVAEAVGRLGIGPLSAFAGSSGGPVVAVVSAGRPELFERLFIYGSYANGAEIADPEAREALLSVVRGHWGLGSRVLADVFMPTASGEERQAFSAFQRASAPAETAARSLETVYSLDARPILPSVSAPTTVAHRRDDRAIPFELGRDLAARIPGATFVALDGSEHLPWRGDADGLAGAVLEALGIDGSDARAGNGEGGAPETELSPRELEVLRLVAQGLSDREIADRLVLSPHTVHRHVANVRTKLRLPSRAAAAAYAARQGLL